MINTLLTMSLTGSAVVLAWLLADKLAGKRLSAVWHDRILRLALVFMLVPLGAVWEAVSKAALVAFVTGHTVQVPNVMQAAPAVTPDNVLAVLPAVIPEITVVPPAAQPAPVTVSMDLFWVLTAVWAVGAAATLCWKLWTYRRFRKLLNGERRPLSAEGTEVFASCKRELGVNGEVEVSVMPGVPTPMVTGLLRPVILLPDVPLSGEELRYLFLHELTHIKRRDLWVRFCSLWGVVLHWYNPFMHLLDRKIKERSEQSCDERVARSMSRAERLAYGGMLLKLASEPAFKAGTWAVTLSTRESIQKRLGSIVKAGRWTRMDKIVAVVTAVVLLVCGTVAACSTQEPLAVEKEPVQTQQEEPDTEPGSEPEQEPVQEEQDRKLPEVERYGYAQALTEIDWDRFKSQITAAEGQALEKYLPVLEGEEFTWLADNGQIRTDIQGFLDRMFAADGVGAEVAYVEALLFADVFQSGEENLCVLLPHLGYHWIIFHEENDVFYGIDMPVRWFGSVQKDGLYAGSGGAAHHDYHRMSFENGNYTVADIAEVHDNVLFIGGEEKSAAEYEAWKKANLKEEAPWYLPSGMRYGREPESHNEEEPETTKAEQVAPTSSVEVQTVPETVTIGAVSYETFTDEHGVTRLKDAVGSTKYLDIEQLLLLDTLVDGTYPTNRKGETYGNILLADFVGQEPDLIAVTGQDASGNALPGYVWRVDYYADFSDPAVAAKYEEYSEVEDWYKEYFQTLWEVPLYDAEHEKIGIYVVQINNQRTQSDTIQKLEYRSMVEEQKTEDGKTKYTISSDSLKEDVVVKPGVYEVTDTVREIKPDEWPEELWEDLPDGAYPVNSRGETYGNREWRVYLQHEPDLIEAVGTEGEDGYIWWEDPQRYYDSVEELDGVLWNDRGYLIPLYNSEHEQIGWKQETGGYFNDAGDFIKLNKQMVDAIKAQLS